MNASIHYPQSGRKWLPYALFSLSSESMAGSVLESWLTGQLHSLALPEDFIGRVLGSARDSFACIPAEIHQIRLLVYTTVLTPSQGQTWGFFCTVKNVGSTEDSVVSTQEITFFLYVEDGLLKKWSYIG